MSPEKKFRHFLQLLPWAKALIQCWVQELCSGIFWVIEEEDCYEYIKFLSQILNTSLYAFYQRSEREMHFCRNIQFSSKVLFRPHCSRECSQWGGKIKPLYWEDKWAGYQVLENEGKILKNYAILGGSWKMFKKYQENTEKKIFQNTCHVSFKTKTWYSNVFFSGNSRRWLGRRIMITMVW